MKPKYFEKLFGEVKRLSCHIKVAFDQIFRQSLMPYLGLNYELMQVFHQTEWVYDQFFLSVRGFSGSNTLLVVIGLHCLEK